MLIPSIERIITMTATSLSRRVNANSQRDDTDQLLEDKLIKKGEC